MYHFYDGDMNAAMLQNRFGPGYETKINTSYLGYGYEELKINSIYGSTTSAVYQEMDDLEKSRETIPLREPHSDFGSLWINSSDQDSKEVGSRRQRTRTWL